MTTKDVPPTEVAWTYREVRQAVKLSRATIDRLVARGEFPRPRTAGNKFLWDAEEVREWFRRLPRTSG